ncbi:MAG: response regulator [Myxococcales bacterium]|nr:response regulator [Myxococcales bacterium]
MKIEHILIVEDDDEQRDLYALSVQKIGGWSVDLAATGVQALAMLEVRRPDVIVLDVNIPEMTGPEIFSKMRALPATDDVPIIFITALTGDKELADPKVLEPAGIIQKPIELRDFPTQLRRITEAI